MVEILDPDGELQEVQRHPRGDRPLSPVCPAVRERDQLRSFLDEIADREPHRLDDAIGGRGHRMLHLHRLDDHQRFAPPHRVADLDHQLRDPSRHRRGQPPGGRVLVRSRGERVEFERGASFRRR